MEIILAGVVIFSMFQTYKIDVLKDRVKELELQLRKLNGH